MSGRQFSKNNRCVKLVTKKSKGPHSTVKWLGCGFDGNDASTRTNALPLCPAHPSGRKQKVAKLLIVRIAAVAEEAI